MAHFRCVTQNWFITCSLAACAACWLATCNLATANNQVPDKEKESASKAEAGSPETPQPTAHPASDAQGEGRTSEANAHGQSDGGHDDTDLSHQNATPKLVDPSEWKSDLAICSLIVFLGLLLLLTRFAWGPVLAGLEKRERAIAANIEEAKRSAEKAAVQLRQYEARLAAAAEEAREIVGQARKDAESAKDRILAEAQAIAQRERQRAVEDINMAKKAALQEMTEKSVDLAVSIAGQLLRKQLNRDDQANLVREMLDKFPSRN